eukprot:s2308_g7.t1
MKILATVLQEDSVEILVKPSKRSLHVLRRSVREDLMGIQVPSLQEDFVEILATLKARQARRARQARINAHIDSYVLLQGHAMTLRQDGLLWFSTRPIWLDVASVLGDNWAEGVGSVSGHIQVEYYRSLGQRGPCKALQLPLQRGLWLVSESAERAVSLVPMSEMRSVHSPSEEMFTVLSPSHSASSASIQSGDSRRRDVDGWAAFLS